MRRFSVSSCSRRGAHLSESQTTIGARTSSIRASAPLGDHSSNDNHCTLGESADSARPLPNWCASTRRRIARFVVWRREVLRRGKAARAAHLNATAHAARDFTCRGLVQGFAVIAEEEFAELGENRIGEKGGPPDDEEHRQ